MGRKKLLKKLSDFFDLDVRDRDRRKEELNDLLARLKKKESELIAERDSEKDDKLKNKLGQKIDIVHSQRKKGLQMLKELKGDS